MRTIGAVVFLGLIALVVVAFVAQAFIPPLHRVLSGLLG